MSNKMKLVVYLSFVLFSFSLATTNVYKNGVTFIPLLKQIRTFYSSPSSAVFFVQPRNNDVVFYESLTHTWCRLLARINVATMAITMEEMSQSLGRYYSNIVCPLIVVLITGEPAFHEFSKQSKSIKMSFASWFVIFVPMPLYDANRFCYHPPGNPFHLSFDSKMMVMCEHDFTLREWYSVDGMNTEIFDLAEWHPDQGFSKEVKLDMFTNLSIHERRKDLKGTVLRAVTVKTSSLFKLINGEIQGHFGRLITELKKSLNFTIDVVATEYSYGSINTTTNTWSGAMRLVVNREVDIGVSDFSMSKRRLDYVDFTIPMITTRIGLIFKQPELLAVKWSAYFQTFNIMVWTSVVLIVFIAQFVLAFMRSRVESCCVKKMIYDEFIRIWSILCQQGLTDFTQNSSLRLAYFSVSIFALVISAAYSAMLICFLTSNIRKPPFRTIEEFIEDGSYKLIVIRNTADYDMFVLSQDSLSKAMMQLMVPNVSLPNDTQTAYKNLCSAEKLAFYGSFGSKLHKISKLLHIPCKTFALNFGKMDSLSMVLTKDSQYTAVFNYHLQKILNSGLLDRYETTLSHEETKFQPVGFSSVASVLVIFFTGVSMSFMILIAEMRYYKNKSIEDSDRSSH